MTTGAFRALLLAIVASGTGIDSAYACSCPQQPLCQAVWSADAVFAGTVRTIEYHEAAGENGNQSVLEEVRFDVERSFLGPAGRGATIVLNRLSTCSYRFEKGGRYLVYANRMDDGGLRATICSRTRPLEDAEEDVRYLAALPPSGAGARVFGRITESRRDPAEPEVIDYGPLERVAVSVRGATFTRELVTDAHGQFEATNLPPGTITLSIFPPPGFHVLNPEMTFELGDRGCAEANFPLSQIASAYGRVVDATGQPVPGVMVDAVAAELAGYDPPPYQHPVTSDESGRFTFEGLPPGVYVFGTNLTVRPGTKRTARPIFLPGTYVPREAAVIELRAGDNRDLGILRVQ